MALSRCSINIGLGREKDGRNAGARIGTEVGVLLKVPDPWR
jgi:hypothetical protein